MERQVGVAVAGSFGVLSHTGPSRERPARRLFVNRSDGDVMKGRSSLFPSKIFTEHKYTFHPAEMILYQTKLVDFLTSKPRND